MIEGERVRLRALEPEDAEKIHRWGNDPEVGRWMETGYPRSLAQYRKRAENARSTATSWWSSGSRQTAS